MRRSSALIGLMVMAVLPFVAAAQSGQARALELFNAAVRENAPARQIELFRQSVQAFETYEGSVALGDSLLRSGGDPLEARRLCTRAFDKLVPPGAPQEKRLLATALVCLARSYRATSERGMATVILKRSLELERIPSAEQELREVMDSGFKSAETIAKELTAAGGRDSRGAGVPRGAVPMEVEADIYINFEFDSARLTADGAKQVGEVARALNMIGKDVARQRFSVIGHTDTRGTDDYNAALSKRRAQAVADLLVGRYQIAQSTVVVEGRGKREPLLSGDSEDVHARNRRVAVQLAP